MSVETEILRIQQNIANAYAAVSGKGGQVPLQPTSENLFDAINTIPASGGSSGGNPVGTVISFMGTSAPEGYLVCDGAVKNISDYPALSSFFEAQFGSKNYFGGNGASTFAVPDMRNLFLRGYHGGAAALSGGIGAKQEATEHPNVRGGYSSTWGGYIYTHATDGYWESTYKNEDSASSKTTLASYVETQPDDDKNQIKPVSYTSRPVNMAVLYCIKAV